MKQFEWGSVLIKQGTILLNDTQRERHVYPTKIPISLRIRTDWSEFSLSAWRILQPRPSEMRTRKILVGLRECEVDLNLRRAHLSDGTLSDIAAPLFCFCLINNYVLWFSFYPVLPIRDFGLYLYNQPRSGFRAGFVGFSQTPLLFKIHFRGKFWRTLMNLGYRIHPKYSHSLNLTLYMNSSTSPFNYLWMCVKFLDAWQKV